MLRIKAVAKKKGSLCMLYNKYRPSNFKEMVGQEHLQELFANAFKHRESFSHSLLFVGERGTGKTTSARIWAKMVNCENPSEIGPCGHCRYCKEIEEGNIDIIEFDAASNRGVDAIKALKEKVQLVSTIPNRVFIIDEVHMLSKEAFNALLLTLEEPPQNTLFILCTTELHKVPPTIISRCARFNFRAMDLVTIASHLAYVCEKENIPYELKALNLIAKSANGSMRDALSLLEQLSVRNLSEDNVRTALGFLPNELLFSMVTGIIGNDIQMCFNVLNQVETLGTSATFVDSMISMLVDYAAIKSGAEVANYEDYILTLKNLPDCNCNVIFNAVRQLSQVRNASGDIVSIKAAVLNIIACSIETHNNALVMESIEDLYDRVEELEDAVERESDDADDADTIDTIDTISNVVSESENMYQQRPDISTDAFIECESSPFDTVPEKKLVEPFESINMPAYVENQKGNLECELRKKVDEDRADTNSTIVKTGNRIGTISANKGVRFFGKKYKEALENKRVEDTHISNPESPKSDSFIEDMMKRMYGI